MAEQNGEKRSIVMICDDRLGGCNGVMMMMARRSLRRVRVANVASDISGTSASFPGETAGQK